MLLCETNLNLMVTPKMRRQNNEMFFNLFYFREEIFDK